MRISPILLLACFAASLGVCSAGTGGNLGGYLTKDGQLTQTLEVRDLQGGFAGFTGTYYKMEADGKWSTGKVFQAKLTEQRAGALAQDELAKLAKVLAKFDLLTLKSSGKPGTNPHVAIVKFGKLEATLNLGTGVKLPKVDAQAKVLTAEQRFAGIVEAVREVMEKGKE